jgi:shikimate dehydrogenase
VGTYPDVQDVLPLPYEALTPQHWVYDMVYNPPQTKFLACAHQQGARTLNGFTMLEGQADAAWDIWSNYWGSASGG